MNKRRITIVASITILLVLSIVAMQGLSSMKEEPKMMKMKESIRYVKAAPVIYDDVLTQMKASGRLSSQKYVDLSAEVQGKIMAGAVPLKKGQNFAKGQLLAKINNKEALLGLKARKSRFLNSIASLLPDFKIDYNDSYSNWLEFFEAIDLAKPLPEMPEIKSSPEKIYLASRNVLNDYYTIQSEEERIKKYSIYAPFSGSFTEVYMEAGAIANPGTRLAKMIQVDKLELEVPVNVKDAKWLRKGTLVKVTSNDENTEWDGRIIRISDFVDAKTQSRSIFVALNSSKDKPVYNGAYLSATFSGIKFDNAMEIPRVAVFNQNEVFVVREGKLQILEIEILKINEKTLIFKGLNEGEEIVMEALINASQGTKVEIIRDEN